MHSGTKDVLSGAVLLVVAAGAFAVGSAIPNTFQIGVGSGFMPQVAGVVLGIIALSIMISGLRGWRRESDPYATSILPENVRPVGLTLLLILIYTALMGQVGFIVSTSFYLVAQFYVLAPNEERRPLTFVIVAIAVAIVVHQVFTRGFDLILPAGILI